VAVKEKMLMKLEKDRLVAKVDNLEMSYKQMIDEEQQTQADANASPVKAKKDKLVFKMTNVPSIMPTKDRPNPFLSETYDPSGTHMSCLK